LALKTLDDAISKSQSQIIYVEEKLACDEPVMLVNDIKSVMDVSSEDRLNVINPNSKDISAQEPQSSSD